MMHLEGFIVALLTSVLVVRLHYEGLRLISFAAHRVRAMPRHKMLLVILGVIAAHMVEAAVFGVAFWFATEVLRCGRFEGEAPANAFQYYAFALETYTTQSVGDVRATGGVRIIGSIEPLVGLILIGWSTSLTFVEMRRYWRMTPRRSAGS